MANVSYLTKLGVESAEELDLLIEKEFDSFELSRKLGFFAEDRPICLSEQTVLCEEGGVRKTIYGIICEIKQPSPIQDPIDQRGYAELNNFSDFVKYVSGKVQILEMARKKQPF